jgi:hypothetical protein
MTRAESTGKVENNANIEMDKISKWARDNKIKFNEEKPKVMLLTRRKRKEQKKVAVYLNNKGYSSSTGTEVSGYNIRLQINISRPHKIYSREMYKTNICTSKVSKDQLRTGPQALKTTYVEEILPLLLYCAPVWIKAIEKEKYKNKVTRVQRLINIKMAKAYRTVSSEALRVVTGMTPIHLKIEEAAEL